MQIYGGRTKAKTVIRTGSAQEEVWHEMVEIDYPRIRPSRLSRARLILAKFTMFHCSMREALYVTYV